MHWLHLEVRIDTHDFPQPLHARAARGQGIPTPRRSRLGMVGNKARNRVRVVLMRNWLITHMALYVLHIMRMPHYAHCLGDGTSQGPWSHRVLQDGKCEKDQGFDAWQLRSACKHVSERSYCAVTMPITGASSSLRPIFVTCVVCDRSRPKWLKTWWLSRKVRHARAREPRSNSSCDGDAWHRKNYAPMLRAQQERILTTRSTFNTEIKLGPTNILLQWGPVTAPRVLLDSGSRQIPGRVQREVYNRGHCDWLHLQPRQRDTSGSGQSPVCARLRFWLFCAFFWVPSAWTKRRWTEGPGATHT